MGVANAVIQQMDDAVLPILAGQGWIGESGQGRNESVAIDRRPEIDHDILSPDSHR
jgi:hypothetical protein